MKGDAVYFGERAKQERTAAMRAANLQAREAHLELAKRYDDLAAALVTNEHGPVIAA